MNRRCQLAWSSALAAALLVPLGGAAGSPARAAERTCDLLIVGGSESGTAAAVQAARLGVARIVLVNDIGWLGGQFTAEGVGAVDEWTEYRGRRTWFPRSGLFGEIIEAIRADNVRKYGRAEPGNCFCGWTTCTPRETEALFRQLIEPYLAARGGPVEIIEHYEPVRVERAGRRITAVEFAAAPSHPGLGGPKPPEPLRIHPRLSIDASDFGDVVRLSGTPYLRGPDLRRDFGEPSAPVDYDATGLTEMNPITYCVVLREAARPSIVAAPPGYDERQHLAATMATRTEFQALGWPTEAMRPFARAWEDTALPDGPYTGKPTLYHHRRLVDRRHFDLAPGTEMTFLNWPTQDYPLCDLPAAFEAAGVAGRNLVDLGPDERRLVFADAKRHALGLLRHLQTTVADRDAGQAVTFRDLELTDEFGTPDRLPWKPYVREGLRPRCLYMLREQDVRDTDGVQSWAASMVGDAVFAFQFNIDFHPTRRVFLGGDRAAPWNVVHTKARNWSTDTDRAGFPLRSLVPRDTDGLLVAGKNLGVTSLVQAAVRLHGHGMHAGQAAATVAAVALNEGLEPRDVAARLPLVRRVQRTLVEPPADPRTGRMPPGLLLWPYHDVPVEAPYFAAANHLAVLGVLRGDLGTADFEPARPVTRAELRTALDRAARLTETANPHAAASSIGTAGTAAADEPASKETATRADLWHGLDALGWSREAAAAATPDGPLDRAGLAIALWAAIRERAEVRPGYDPARYLAPGHDTDGDDRLDLDDPLPFDADNDNTDDVFSRAVPPSRPK